MGIIGDILGSTRQMPRLQQVGIEGSPTFEFDNPQILANATWQLNLESQPEYGNQIAKYLPLDFIEVLNDQSENLNLVLNDVSVYRVLGNAQRSVENRKFTGVKLVNQSANTIAANTFKVVVERLPLTQDSAVRRAARAKA